MVNIKTYLRKFRKDLRSTTGRNILTFLVFMLISTIFWFLMALNDEVQKDYRIPVKLENFPANLTIISGNIEELNVTVKDKGSTLARFAWGATPQLRLKYEDFTKVADNHLLLNEQQLNSAIRSIYGTGASIIGIKPDSLYFYYTTLPGIPVKVRLDAEISTLPQYESFGPARLSQDSVLLYSNAKERVRISEIPTVPVNLTHLSDTTVIEARLMVPEGMRAVPSTITVTFPVEPLVSKTRELPIEAINVPKGIRLITFPAVTEVTYLLPKSTYSAPTTSIKAIVDYNSITPGAKSIPVNITGVPSYCHSASLSVTSVEYLIEKE